MNNEQNKQLQQITESAKANLRRDVAQLSFDGPIVTGSLGLVSIDMVKAKMMVRRHAGSKPFCYIDLPTKAGREHPQEALLKALTHPKLKRAGLALLDDITAALWAYINIRLLEKPLDMDPDQNVAGSR